MRLIPILGLLLLPSAAAGGTQQPASPATQQTPARPNPARDTSATPVKGTAVLRGKVVAADSRRPLRRARVTVSASGLGQDGRRSTSTALDGTFVLKDLPAARYRITVARGGYLQLEYGQRRPGEQGRPVQIADGQVVDRIDFALPRMSGVFGRITDETGEPIEGVAVYAMRSLFFDGRRRLVPVSGSSVRTDEEGEYRLLSLPPGSYQVMASTKETWTVVENGVETMFGYMPTYFPGVPAPADARRVTLGLGEQVRAVDFSLVPGRTAKVSGIALDSQGKPFTRVSLNEEVRGLNFASFGGGPNVVVAADGTFTAVNVPPGEYSLQASRTAGADGPAEAALMTVSVEGTDIENIVLTGSGGGVITGRVVTSDGPLPKVSSIFVNAGEIFRNQPPPVLLGMRRDGGSPAVAEDGTFTINHVFGRARFQITLPDGWMLKHVRHEGKDITDSIVELKSGQQLTGVEVMITNKLTELSGQVTGENGTPVVDATVLVFPSDDERWFESSRAMRATRPDQQGRWQFKGLPAGDYLAIALDYVEDNAWQDPEYLASLRKEASRMTIADGGAHTLSLKVTTPKQ